MRLSRRHFLYASAGAAATGLVGCGDGSGGAGVTVVSAAGAATPTPSPTATTTAAATTAAIVQSGDSIGAGWGTNYTAIDHLNFASGVAIYNVSVPGRTLSDAYGARAADLFGFYTRQYPCILLNQIGSNDLGGGTAGDDLYNRLATPFVKSAIAAGFYVVLNTILPRADVGWSSAKEAQRLLYNRLVRANAAGADAINDVAADPVVGDPANPASSGFYLDGLHPSAAGQQRLAQIDAAALSPLLTRSLRFV